jgi:hypothetical protein
MSTKARQTFCLKMNAEETTVLRLDRHTE